MSMFQDDFHPNIDQNKTSKHFHQVAIVQDHHRIPGFVKVDIASCWWLGLVGNLI